MHPIDRSSGRTVADARERPAIAIGVPVRNEAARLPRMLLGLAAQAGAPPFTLCIFFDSCDDGSVALVTALAGRLPYAVRMECSEHPGPPNAGLARRRAMALAESVAPDGVLLTTDADGEHRPDWLASNLTALSAADIVAGRIVRADGPESAPQDRIECYYDRLHAVRRAIDPVAWEAIATHHWTSAASLAMQARTYRAIGGFAPVENGEDAAFCDAAARAGYRLRRDAAAVVHTSARRHGRAKGGLAAALAMLDGDPRPVMTSHPEDEAWRFRMQAEARRRHGTGDYSGLASRLRLPLAEVEQVAAECVNGEAFAVRIVGDPPTGMRSITLPHAELLLSALEQARYEGVA